MKSNVTVLTIILALAVLPRATAQIAMESRLVQGGPASPLESAAARRPSLQVFRDGYDSFDWTVAGNSLSYSETISSVKTDVLGRAVLIRGSREFFGDARTYRFTIRLSWDTFGCIQTGKITAGGKSVKF